MITTQSQATAAVVAAVTFGVVDDPEVQKAFAWAKANPSPEAWGSAWQHAEWAREDRAAR